MLSERKRLLRAAEVAALVSSVCAMALAAQSHLRPVPLSDFFATAGMALLMLTFLPACVLTGEYVRTMRAERNWQQRTSGLDAREIAELVRWAPRTYKWAAVAGLLMGFGSALGHGGIRLSGDSMIRPDDVMGFALGFAMFYLLSLPVLASAARMRGGYGE